ncbi:hypothetical protein BKA66DRAFT_13132 [Pyrenochaeta sp. MPI-SDFR-AT-0127]|nr:hypothetical protein BKA66DRAFT_13132 [Pyrenochaeta sp. MPI-SDFR-AT-0127]
MIFDLRSLTPAQRYNTHATMAVFGNSWLREGITSPNANVFWQLICELSESLKQKERVWYAQYTEGHTSDKNVRLESLKQVFLRQASAVAVTGAEIIRAAWAEAKFEDGHLRRWIPPATVRNQQFQHSKEDVATSLQGNSKKNPIDLQSDTQSPWSDQTAVFGSKIAPNTPLTSVSSNEEESHISSSYPSEPGVEALTVGQKRRLEVLEDTDEQKAAKKCRTDRIEGDLQRYETHRDAIEAWWKPRRKESKTTWYEKLYAWEKFMGISTPPIERRVRRKPHVQQLAHAEKDTKTQLPNGIPRTAGMTSPAEILHIRKQWAQAGLKPDVYKHPLDKVPAPEYPWADRIEDCAKRSDGRYACRHINGTSKCCQDGLDVNAKKKSISKDKTGFKKAVEQAVVAGDLHVAHITWDHWYNKTIAAKQKMAQIDSLLRAVQTRHKLVATSVARAAIQEQQQPVAHPVDINSVSPPQALMTEKVNARRASIAAPAALSEAQQPSSASAKRISTTRIIPAAPTRTPNTVHDFQQTAMAAILRQMKQVEPVYVGGFNLFKGPYKHDLEGVTEKIVRVLKTQAREDATEAAPFSKMAEEVWSEASQTREEAGRSTLEGTLEPADNSESPEVNVTRTQNVTPSPSSLLVGRPSHGLSDDPISNRTWDRPWTWQMDEPALEVYEQENTSADVCQEISTLNWFQSEMKKLDELEAEGPIEYP